MMQTTEVSLKAIVETVVDAYLSDIPHIGEVQLSRVSEEVSSRVYVMTDGKTNIYPVLEIHGDEIVISDYLFRDVPLMNIPLDTIK